MFHVECWMLNVGWGFASHRRHIQHSTLNIQHCLCPARHLTTGHFYGKASPMKHLFIALTILAILPGTSPAPQRATATFAGGCFWCMQPPFERLKGVISVKAGYTGGRGDKPTYEEVSSGGTGHRESVEVVYDPRQISYQQLLDVFWHNIDPLDDS